MKANKEIAVFLFYSTAARQDPITACYYHKTALHYSRIVAISGKRSMLFFRRRFSKNAFIDSFGGGIR